MAGLRIPSWRPSLGQSVVLLVVIVCLCVIGLDLQQTLAARDRRLREVMRETSNLARSLAEHAKGSFQTADAMLIGLCERFDVSGKGIVAMGRMERLMRVSLLSEPLINSLSLLDEHGSSLASTVTGTGRALNYADRDYFRYHRDHPRHAMLIGRPVRSKINNAWLLTVSRRLDHDDGSFAGVIIATIDASLFQQFYNTFDIGAESVITMVDDVGEVLVRRPYREENVGRNITASRVFRLSRTASRSGSFAFVSSIDATARLGSFYRVSELNITLIVSRKKDEALAVWRRQVGIDLCWLVLVLASIGGLCHHVLSQIRERGKAERLYRLLADNSGDAIICTGLDGRHSYASPAYWSMIGWRPQDLLSNPGRHIHPDDQTIIAAGHRRLLLGEPIVSSRYRYLRPDGSVIWAELRARLAASSPGSLPEFIASIRDITKQKTIEDELAEANTELSAMTLTDPLTGIANRRHFEQTLRKEWNRAMRNGSELALVMVDVDHFKIFNDLYGHLAGDECLRAMARALAGAVLRPGDLVARFGGEEFVVVLPETAADTAALVARRMADNLRDAAIVHAGNATGLVTISAGVASCVPDLNSASTHLIETADTVLYRAKANGRNRIAVADPHPPHRAVLAAE